MHEYGTAEQWARIDLLLNRMLALAPSERTAFIEYETAGDERLRHELQALLAEFDTRGDIFDRPATASLGAVHTNVFLQRDVRIGAYRVLALLGHGGMGEVYRTERADGQFEQEAALKLLRRDSVEHLARFLAERQILARLEHPGIARLYDAGVTDDGRPYMVMELVEGLPITQWCREHNADLSQRLDLFLQVCDAVTYAHQHLVIHRDLKPGNVLVTTNGRAKLLDFGVAKLFSPGVSSDTADTPLTPAYAAPEQLTREGVSTATDTHALGLLLYELLTGQPPWGADHAPIAVTLDRILREEAPAPSRTTRTLTAPPVSSRLLTGDLDAIVAKALRKQPAQRYATVADLQADVRRHLRSEPVAARSGALLYVMGRFVQRYRWVVAGIVAVILALAIGLTTTAKEAHEAARERDIARTEAARSDAVRDYVMLMFREAGENAGDGELTAKQVLESSAQNLMSLPPGKGQQHEEVYQLLGELFAAIDDYEGAAPIFRRYLQMPAAKADPALRAEIQHDLSTAEFNLGNAAEARRLLRLAQAFWNRDPSRYAESLASSRVIQSQLQRAQGDSDGAIRTLRAGLADRIALSGRSDRETAYIMNALALALMNAGQLQEADRVLGECLQIMSALGKQDSAQALTMLSNQGVIAAMLGDNARAEPLLRRAVDLRRKLYGPSAALAALQQNLGRLMVRSGHAREAQPLLEDALAMSRKFTGEHSPMTLTIMLSVAEVQIVQDEAPAEAALQQALRAIAAQLGEQHVLYGRGEELLAHLRLQQGRRAEAKLATDSAEGKLKALGPAGAAYLPDIAKLRQALASDTNASSTR